MGLLPEKWPWGLRQSFITRDAQPQRGEVPKELYRYLATTETVLLGGQLHWAKIGAPTGLLALGTVAIAVAFIKTPDGSEGALNLLALGWVALVVWFAWHWLEWNRDLLFITGYRLIYVHGIITRRVAMMPIGKVTDMSYNRSPLGMLLGYGTFIVESAGQDQALRTIRYVPDPDRTYQHLQDLLFKKVPQDVNLVNVSTPKRVNVGWTGRFRKDPDGRGGHVDQDETTPW